MAFTLFLIWFITLTKHRVDLEPQQSVAKKKEIYQDKIVKVKENISIISHKSLGSKKLFTTYEPEEYEYESYIH